jgi:phosphogluconate dehydratase
MTAVNDTVRRVTDRVIARSAPTRSAYLETMAAARAKGVARAHLSCSGQAHAYAASGPTCCRPINHSSATPI